MIEFAAIVSNASDVEYELVLEYGTGRCTSYQYIYSSKANTHNKSSKKDTASGASSWGVSFKQGNIHDDKNFY